MENCICSSPQGWPSGLGSELIIRLRQVRFLHPGFIVSGLELTTGLTTVLTSPAVANAATTAGTGIAGLEEIGPALRSAYKTAPQR